MAKTKAISVADIIISPELQTRGGINENHVQDIAEAIHRKVKVKPPRIMQIDDEADAGRHGKLYAIDQHRVMAYRLENRQKVPAVLLAGTWQDARDLASSSNAEHTGLKRSRSDKQRAVLMCLADHPKWTDGNVAKHCAVSVEMVRGWRPEVPEAASVPTEERVGSDGRKRPIPAIAKKAKKTGDDPDRFQPILSAFANCSRAVNEAMNSDLKGADKLLAYLSYFKLVLHPNKVIENGEDVSKEPKFKGFPILGFIVRAALKPGGILSKDDLTALIEKWKTERESFNPTRSK